MSATDLRNDILRTLGAAPDVDRIVPGRIVRFSANGKRGDDAGWCKLFADGQAGVFGNWRTGEQHTWHAETRAPLTGAERQRRREAVAAAQAARAEEEAQRHARVADHARLIWSRAQPCLEHKYLDRKRVGPDGIRVQFGHAAECRSQFFTTSADGELQPLRGLLLLAPLRDMQWRMWSLQAIDADGRKAFLKGGRTRGLFHLVGADKLRGVDAAAFDDPVAVCEGFATGWSIVNELDGWPTFCALSAGNLKSVAAEVRAKFPNARITLCGDADPVGSAKAREAAAEVGGRIAIPDDFTPDERARGFSDWNDWARTKLPAREGVKA